MIVRALIRSLTGQSLESVQIQLPLEGCKLVLIEVRWHVVLYEFLRFLHHEASAMRHPAHDIFMAILFHFLKHLVQRGGEWVLHTSPGRTADVLLL